MANLTISNQASTHSHRRVDKAVIVLAVVAVLLELGATQSVRGSEYPPVTAMFVFGDSLSDVGNNQYGPPRIPKGCRRYPYGIDFIPQSGRCSDGKLVVDYLAEYLAIPSPPPSLQPQVNALQGLNFASAGATASNLSTTAFNLQTQVDWYLSFRQAVMDNAGASKPDPNLPSPELLSSALYLLAIGSNDYAFTFSNSTASPVAVTEQEDLVSQWGVLNSPEPARNFLALEKHFRSRVMQERPNTKLTFHFVPKVLVQALRDVVGNITAAAEVLLSSGARRLVVAGIPAIGCIPVVRQVLKVPDHQCSKLFDSIARLHNRLLARSIRRLRLLHPHAVILDAKILMGGLQATRFPAVKGVKNAVAACCGAPPPLNALAFCGTTYAPSNGTTIPYTICSNRDDYLYWDLIHPTHVGHKGFADALWSGGKTKMSPMNVKELAQKRA